MSRKFLVTLLLGLFAAGPLSFAYANPDDEERDNGKPSDLVVVVDGSAVK